MVIVSFTIAKMNEKAITSPSCLYERSKHFLKVTTWSGFSSPSILFIRCISIWSILFILGYSSIFDAYSRYEIGKEHITLNKYVSSRDDMRMPYRTAEIDLPAISISFVHTKLQMKSLEKKLEKGKIEKKDMDIPLIYLNLI